MPTSLEFLDSPPPGPFAPVWPSLVLDEMQPQDRQAVLDRIGHSGTVFFRRDRDYFAEFDPEWDEPWTPNWETLVLVAGSSLFVRLENRLSLAEDYQDGRYLLAFRSTPAGSLWDLRLEPADTPETLLRDWTWAWNPTCGPAMFRLFGPQLEVGRVLSLPWLEHRPIRWEGPLWPGQVLGSLQEAYSRGEDGDYYLEGFGSGADGCLRLSEGSLTLYRSYHTPAPSQLSAELSLLGAASQGKLGELDWELFDGDYFQYQAQGPDFASLADYLRPDSPPRDWGIFSQEIDARQATTWEQVKDQVRSLLPTSTRVGEFPRHVTIKMPPQLHITDQQRDELVVPRQVRSFQRGGHGQ